MKIAFGILFVPACLLTGFVLAGAAIATSRAVYWIKR